jgi:hypothetical protein
MHKGTKRCEEHPGIYRGGEKGKKKRTSLLVDLLVQGALAGSIQFFGDILGQGWSGSPHFDLPSALAMGLYGFATGMAVFRWYGLMDRCTPKRLSRRGRAIESLIKVGLDQVVVSPVFTLFYLAYSGIVDGKGGDTFLFVKSSFFPVKSFKPEEKAACISLFREILGLEEGVSESEIEQAYSEAYRSYHKFFSYRDPPAT